MEDFMSDANNPFRSPEADTQIVRPLVSQGALTEIMVKNLSDASPWLRFLGIMGFIGSGLLALVGVLSFFLMPFAGSIINQFPDVFDMFFGSLAPVLVIYAVYFIGAGVVMFFPALFTYRFGMKIRSYVLTSSEAELELAFRNNMSLWKFNGILMIIGMAAVPVLTVVSVFIIFAAMALG
jgi:hypothetical protein